MKTIITSICIAAVLMACGGNKSDEGKKANDTVFKPDSPTVAVPIVATPILTAMGEEPFWNLQIFEKVIKFKMADKDTITASDYKVATNADGSVSYTGGKDFGITVTNQQYKSMKGVDYSKTVTISFQGKKYKGYSGDAVADMSKPTTKEDDKITNVDKSKGERYTVYGKWVLSSLTGLKGALSQFSKGMPNIDLNATANSISGFGGCNTLNGSFAIVDGKKIKIEKLGTTKMFCEGIPEAAFLTALRSADSFAIVNGKLQLKANGAILATFVRGAE